MMITMTPKKPASVYLGDEDREAIAQIKRLYGNMSDGAAMRLALKIASETKPTRKKQGGDTQK